MRNFHKDGNMNISDNLKTGVAELVVLRLLQTGGKYGYQIVQDLARLSGGKFTIQVGSLYPTLYRLLKCGAVIDKVVISDETQRLRKYYSITCYGQEYFNELLADYKSVSEGVCAILESHDTEVTTDE